MTVTLEQIEQRRAEVAKRIRRYMDPFQKQDKNDIRALKRDETLLEAELSREASKLLKQSGFRADGERRKR